MKQAKRHSSTTNLQPLTSNLCLRVEGMFAQDGAHVDLTEEGFEEGDEAVERLREFGGRARGLDLFGEALQRLPVLVHQVALTARVELAEALKQKRRRERARLCMTHELDEREEVAAERERLCELGLERGEELAAVERRVEALREGDDRLPVAVAQQTAGRLKLRVDLRRLSKLTDPDQLVRESLAQLHADGVGRAVEYLAHLRLDALDAQRARLDEVQKRLRLFVDERVDREQALELRVADERGFDEAQEFEQAREALEDDGHVLAQLVRLELARERIERRARAGRAVRVARFDQRGGLRAAQLAFEHATQSSPAADADRRRFEHRLAELRRVAERVGEVAERVARARESRHRRADGSRRVAVCVARARPF